MFAAVQDYITTFTGESVRTVLVDHVEVPVIATVLYMAMVLYVPDTFMKDRPPYNLKKLNTLWNLLLTVFSCTGAYFTLPMLYQTIFVEHYEANLPGGGTEIRTGSLYDCICVWNPTLFYDGPVGAFVCFFILSKVPEMLDTVFLVFQKKRIIFLHWYHHITVMLFCWHAYTYMITSGLIFAAMNYGVHSLMYFYYLMCALGLRRYVRPFAPLITFLQIAQMVVGTYVEILSLYHIYTSGEGCQSNVTNCRLGLMMYASYFALFSKLFKDSYLTKKPKASADSKVAIKDGEQREGKVVVEKRAVVEAAVTSTATASVVGNGARAENSHNGRVNEYQKRGSRK